MPTSGLGGGDEDPSGENGDAKQATKEEEDNVGGYELYMAGDDPHEDAKGSDGGVEIPAKMQSQTGAGDRRNAKRRKPTQPSTPRSTDDDEDDGILSVTP